MTNSQSSLDLCEQIIKAEESYKTTLKLQEETRLALLNSHEHLPDQYQVSASIISMYHENMVKEVMSYLQTLGKCPIPNCVKHSVTVDYENLVQLTNGIPKKNVDIPNGTNSPNINDGFKAPSRVSKRLRTNSNPYLDPIATSSKFTILSDHIPDNMDTDASIDLVNPNSEFTTVRNTSPKIPPIVINNPRIKWAELADELKAAGITNFTGKANPESLNIRVHSDIHYRQVTAILDQKKIDFHTYKMKCDRTLKVILRNVPSDIDVELIKSELTRLGYTIQSVFQFSKTVEGNKIPLPVYFIELPNNENSKKIFNMTDFMHLIVNVAPYKRKQQPTQCHKCQRYGHAKSGCSNTPRCVKCAENHLSADCPSKGRIPNPKCVLCNGPHVASFRGCSKAPKPKDVEEAINETSNPRIAQNSVQQRSTLLPRPILLAREQVRAPRTINSQPIQQGVSFAQALTGNTTPEPQIPSTSSHVEEPYTHPNIESSSNNTQSTNEEPEELNLFDMIRQLQQFLKGTNIKRIFQIAKTTAQKFKTAKGVMAKIEIGLNAFEEIMTALNYE
jgi:hypothetical protein